MANVGYISARRWHWLRALFLISAIAFLMAIAIQQPRTHQLLDTDLSKSRPIVRTHQLLDTDLSKSRPIVITNKRTDTTDRQGKLCSVVPEIPSWDEFYDYVEESRPCQTTVRFGGIAGPNTDGAKTLCVDPGFDLPRNSCLVLSFGINNDFSFDDAMADQLGCDVYSFDPSMRQPNHRRGQRVQFFRVGLGPKDGFVGIKTIWRNEVKQLKVDSYQGILKRLNLVNATIDFLKIDIEQSELFFFRSVIEDHPQLLRNIKQIGMEIHTGDLDTILRNQFWWYLHQMRCFGFRPVSVERLLGPYNAYSIGKREVSASYEIVWVNDAYLELFEPYPRLA